MLLGVNLFKLQYLGIFSINMELLGFVNVYKNLKIFMKWTCFFFKLRTQKIYFYSLSMVVLACLSQKSSALHQHSRLMQKGLLLIKPVPGTSFFLWNKFCLVMTS